MLCLIRPLSLGPSLEKIGGSGMPEGKEEEEGRSAMGKILSLVGSSRGGVPEPVAAGACYYWCVAWALSCSVGESSARCRELLPMLSGVLDAPFAVRFIDSSLPAVFRRQLGRQLLDTMIFTKPGSAPRWTAIFLLLAALCCLFVPAGTWQLELCAR